MTTTIDNKNKYINHHLAKKTFSILKKSKRKSQHEFFVVSNINQSVGMFMFYLVMRLRFFEACNTIASNNESFEPNINFQYFANRLNLSFKRHIP